MLWTKQKKPRGPCAVPRPHASEPANRQNATFAAEVKPEIRRWPYMPMLRNAWYAAGWSDEVEAGKLFARKFLNENVVLYRTRTMGWLRCRIGARTDLHR